MTDDLNSSTDFDVVIVGAGPTGVAAAIFLGQYGVPTLVLDRWTEVFPQPRAAHLDDEVYRILQNLGVEHAFSQVSHPGSGLRLNSPDHRPLLQFDRTEPRTSNGFPQANMFEQPVLETILRTRMSELDSVTFLGGTEVTAVHSDPSERPVVTYTGPDSGETNSVAPRYVLGCDGANSLVRRAIGAGMRNLGFDEQRWLVVDVDASHDFGLWDGVHQVCDSTRAATYIRIGSTRHRWEFELRDGETAADYDAVEKLAPLLAPWTTDIDDLDLVRLAEYTFRAQIADRWRRGGAFLLGDAAHLTPPFIGQGMGAGLRDAANLAWKIAGVLRGNLRESALDSYEAERLPHAEAMTRRSMLVGRAMTSGGKFGDRIRRSVLPTLAHLPGFRDAVLHSSTPPLRRSSFNNRSRLRRSLAGSLCPNADLTSGRRYDAIAGTGFSLVVRAPLPPDAADMVARAGVAVITAADVPALDSWLGRHRAALVRPDRTVMVAGRTGRVLRSVRALGHLSAA